MQRKLLAFVATLLLSILTQSAYALEWQDYSDQVLTASKVSNQPIMIFCKAKWCPWCHKMNDTFADDGVALLIKRNFIAVRIDVEDDATIAAQYHIKKIPAVVFLNSDGQVLDKVYGYQSSADMIRLLQKIAYQYHRDKN